MNIEEILNLFYLHKDLIDWERYDFVDPPYCWSVGFEFTINGYTFYGDGNEVIGYEEEINNLWVNTPEGEYFQLI